MTLISCLFINEKHYIENICFSCINVHIEAPAVVYSDHFSLLCDIFL